MNNTQNIHVKTKKEAWRIVDSLFPTDYEKDEESSLAAGYDVYRKTNWNEETYYNYICDLNIRLEVNLSNGKTVNVWIDELNDELNDELILDRLRKELAETTRRLYPKGGN